MSTTYRPSRVVRALYSGGASKAVGAATGSLTAITHAWHGKGLVAMVSKHRTYDGPTTDHPRVGFCVEKHD